MRFPLETLASLIVVTSVSSSAIADESFPNAPDTEKSTTPFLSAEETAETFTIPDGFQVTVFAAEPDVRQPIALATDGRGRLWVAENYTYSSGRPKFDESLRDRIVILEDSDGDGRADRRTVFWDHALSKKSQQLHETQRV